MCALLQMLSMWLDHACQMIAFVYCSYIAIASYLPTLFTEGKLHRMQIIQVSVEDLDDKHLNIPNYRLPIVMFW